MSFLVTAVESFAGLWAFEGLLSVAIDFAGEEERISLTGRWQ